MDLIQSVAEAKAFCASIPPDADRYRLYPTEAFISFAEAVFTTTEADRQNEQLAVEGIEECARGLSGPAMWMGAHHDPLIQPIGRVLAAGSFYSVERDIHFVAGVIGFYDQAMYATFSEVSDALLPEREIMAPADAELGAVIEASQHEIDPSELRDLILAAPEFVNRDWIPQFRKTADPMAILTISVSIAVALFNPFSRKFLETVGEAAGKQSLDFLKWLSGPVSERVRQLKLTPMVEICTQVDDCRVLMVVDRRNVSALAAAAERLPDGFQSAIGLAEQMRPLQPDRVVYEFDTASSRWLPLYVVTRKRGVITDRPKLIAIDTLRGMSLGGRGHYLPGDSDD